MSPYALSIMLSSLALGTTLTFSSSHWLLAWMGLEINTLAIIPLMTKHHHPRATEASTKYFLTQATASTLILFSTLTNAWMTGQWELKEMSTLPSNMLTVAIMMKLGVAPMHFWLPEVLQGVDLTTGLILTTWQKLAPMSLIFMIYNSLNPNLMMLLGLLSVLVGGWSGLNQTQLRKIMAFSSIAHMGWMMTILPFSQTLFILNLSLYLMMTLAMFLMLKYFNVTKFNSLSLSWSKTPTLAASSTIILLSLGGLPPTTGFMPKWLILHELTKQHLLVMATVMAISALLSLFFYLRLSYSLSLTKSPNTTNSTTLWRYKSNQPTMMLAIMTILSLTLLPLTPYITLM
uniref:NADH-ubiquinone oxidoreductase chain 2 n=1 Tax=Indotyphlus maharashtraensis TaxID=1035548 RepID=W5RHE4_INDMA|nr:NADH dehydrogenase subunit 2 [Indotyphlus maharashtraensis]AGZ19022.1 NADH dehydrogenase subunit 2 [Indotyphlus maharashtraensis]